MSRVVALLLAAALSLLALPGQAQRVFNQGELDALLAPLALYPDALLSQALMATTYPDEVEEAAAWSRANPHLRGEAAVKAVSDKSWDDSVKSLVAFPELLARMAESPQWMGELGEAFLYQQPQVMDTVQALRRRAQASGGLRDSDYYSVEQQGPDLVVSPRNEVVYLPYYDPMQAYGSWWWPAYRPVYWAPWATSAVIVSSGVFFAQPDWRHRHFRIHRHFHHSHAHRSAPHPAAPRHGSSPHSGSPPHSQPPQAHAPARWQRRDQHGRPSPRPLAPSVTPHVRVPEANRQPIISSTPQLGFQRDERRSERRMIELPRHGGREAAGRPHGGRGGEGGGGGRHGGRR